MVQWASGTERSGPVEVEGTATFPPADGLWNVPLEFDVHYRYANGMQLHYTDGKPFVHFEGTEGWIRIEYGPDKLPAHPATILDSWTTPDDVTFPLKDEKRDFIDCVKTRSQTMADAEVGHRTCSMGQIAHIAIQRRKKLEWDPDKEQFRNDDKANQMLVKSYREPWGLDIKLGG